MLVVLYIICWSATVCTVMYVVVEWIRNADNPLKERLPAMIVGVIAILILTAISIYVTDQIKI